MKCNCIGFPVSPNPPRVLCLLCGGEMSSEQIKLASNFFVDENMEQAQEPAPEETKMDNAIYSYKVKGDLYCTNPHVPGAQPLNKQQTIYYISYGVVKNECSGCGELIIPIDDLVAAFADAIEIITGAPVPAPVPAYSYVRKPIERSTLKPLSYCNLCGAYGIPLRAFSLTTGANQGNTSTTCQNCAEYVGIYLLRMFQHSPEDEK